MKPYYKNESMPKRDVRFPDSLWEKLDDQARIVSAELGRKMSRADLVRKACEDLLKKLSR